MRYLRILLLTCLALLSSFTFASAGYHNYKSFETGGGNILSPMMHDQIEPIWKNHGAIADLAAAALADQTWTGPERDAFFDVYTFGRTAYRNTLWGYAPGDVLNSDANPWHLPTHAYIRADFWMLEALHKAFPENAAITERYYLVNDAMNGLMGLCRYSSVGFDTATTVGADWSLIQPQLNQLLQVLAAIALALLSAALMALALLGQRQRKLNSSAS